MKEDIAVYKEKNRVLKERFSKCIYAIKIVFVASMFSYFLFKDVWILKHIFHFEFGIFQLYILIRWYGNKDYRNVIREENKPRYRMLWALYILLMLVFIVSICFSVHSVFH